MTISNRTKNFQFIYINSFSIKYFGRNCVFITVTGDRFKIYAVYETYETKVMLFEQHHAKNF